MVHPSEPSRAAPSPGPVWPRWPKILRHWEVAQKPKWKANVHVELGSYDGCYGYHMSIMWSFIKFENFPTSFSDKPRWTHNFSLPSFQIDSPSMDTATWKVKSIEWWVLQTAWMTMLIIFQNLTGANPAYHCIAMHCYAFFNIPARDPKQRGGVGE